MSAAKPLPWLELGVTAFCAVRAGDLVAAWRHAPLDRFGWVALIVWLAPLLRREESHGPWKAVALLAALLLAVLATVADLHVLGHAALACAFVSWRRGHWSTLVWLATAICWMTVFGWALRSLGPNLIIGLRLGTALLGAAIMLRPRRAPLLSA